MKNLFRKSVAIVYFLHMCVIPLGAEPAYLDDDSVPGVIGVRSEGDNIIIEMSRLLPYKTTNLPSQSKLIIEIQGAAYKAGFTKKNMSTNLVRRVRGYQFKESPLIARIVLDLKSPVDYTAFNVGSNLVLVLKKNTRNIHKRRLT